MKQRLIAAALCLTILFSFTGCGTAPKIPNTPEDLEIVYWNSGHGTTFMNNLISAFKQKYPHYNVHFTPDSQVQVMPIYSSPKTNTVDLYLSTFSDMLAYSQYLEPLDDILTAKVDGNNVTIGEKIGYDYLDNMRAQDEKIYALPWASSVNGLIYNADVFATKGYSLPRTTNELQSLALTIKSDGFTPFIHLPAYWRYLWEAWWAQLDGVDAYFDVAQAIYRDGGNVYQNDVRSFTQQNGKYHALAALEPLLSPNGYTYTGTNSLTHTTSQTRFLAGDALMMPNGSWVENEMRSIQNRPNIGLMKTPVISKLGTDLGISENQLRIAVSHVDDETLTPTEQTVIDGLDSAVIERIRVARSITYTEKPQFHMLIPEYSNAKVAAKDFIKFYYSDDGLKIAASAIQMPMPAKLSTGVIDTSAWSGFAKNCFELADKMTPIFSFLRTPLFYNGGIQHLYNLSNDPARRFTYSSNSSDMWDLETWWTNEKTYWNTNWATFMYNAGLTA